MPSRRIGGWSLIGGAILFWMSWFLMPEPGSVGSGSSTRPPLALGVGGLVVASDDRSQPAADLAEGARAVQRRARLDRLGPGAHRRRPDWPPVRRRAGPETPGSTGGRQDGVVDRPGREGVADHVDVEPPPPSAASSAFSARPRGAVTTVSTSTVHSWPVSVFVSRTQPAPDLLDDRERGHPHALPVEARVDARLEPGVDVLAHAEEARWRSRPRGRGPASSSAAPGPRMWPS